MNALWTELVGAMLRPARPRLSVCRRRADAHVLDERRADDRRTQALAECRAKIEDARASVFAAGDGVVRADMTALEREWRTLARAERSCAERTLSLWNEIAPRHWAGRLRWTSSGDLATDTEAAVALASDPSGVEHAEGVALRLAAGASGASGAGVTWHVAAAPTVARVSELLGGVVSALTDAITPRYGGEALLARADEREREVFAAASQSAVIAGIEGLAADMALVARIDFLWRTRAVEAGAGAEIGAGGVPVENPASVWIDLWRTGYVVSAIDAGAITLGALTA